MLQSGFRQLARRSVRHCAAVSELATTVAHAAPPAGQRCFLVASTPSLSHFAPHFSTFLSSGLFANNERPPLPLLDAMKHGTAGVLLTRHSSGGLARASSDQEGEKAARVYGEKDEQGRPLTDADTVAFLLEKEVWRTGEEVSNELFRADKNCCWPFGTVSAAWAFLVSVLEEPGALAAVRRRPRLLSCSADTLRKNWDALLLVFCWTLEQAQRKVIESPDLLKMSLDGTIVGKRAVLLDAGFSDKAFIKMVTRFPKVLTLSSEHLEGTIDWLSRHVDDPVPVLIAQPGLFGWTAAVLDEKVAFIRLMGYDVMSAITTTPAVLKYGRPRLELRFFLLLYFEVLKGWTRDAADGCALGTWATAGDEVTSKGYFGALGCFKDTAYASMTEAERRSFKSSPKFLAFQEEKKAERSKGQNPSPS